MSTEPEYPNVPDKSTVEECVRIIRAQLDLHNFVLIGIKDSSNGIVIPHFDSKHSTDLVFTILSYLSVFIRNEHFQCFPPECEFLRALPHIDNAIRALKNKGESGESFSVVDKFLKGLSNAVIAHLAEAMESGNGEKDMPVVTPENFDKVFDAWGKAIESENHAEGNKDDK